MWQVTAWAVFVVEETSEGGGVACVLEVVLPGCRTGNRRTQQGYLMGLEMKK